MYAKGEGVAIDAAEAASWFLRAAEQGDALGQFNYAVILTKGLGVETDVAQAVAGIAARRKAVTIHRRPVSAIATPRASARKSIGSKRSSGSARLPSTASDLRWPSWRKWCEP